MSETATTVYLADYQPPAYWIDSTDLTFDLHPNRTRVIARLKIRRNRDLGDDLPPLVLSGRELKLEEVMFDGCEAPYERYRKFDGGLEVDVPAAEFELGLITRINPEGNSALEGLYLSNGMYCTQCEAEGFRKITYYLDRPDVMSVFTTTVIADQSLPVLLSNGNPMSRGKSEDGRHWVRWHDPFKKPAYLFALVAGDLERVTDRFTTSSGRSVQLAIYTEAKNISKCDHAMRSLKAAMRWDEERFGREYDLDLFNIVAVDHFNMGAMENKGLNIFNSACVLARPDTSTDAAFQRIEAIVGHEYFHNWSGNRVTCRDWFQLSLKEGFTVFRDAEFSADLNSRAVKRIEDVSLLRSAQFAEDAGPMAHPVRPASFMEISNFYTLTVYEKGAEVVRMLHTLLGEERFRQGSDLYFERHDGQAVTCDDFVQAMSDVSGEDLSQFKLWYSQAGTPEVSVSDSFEQGTYSLTLRQHCPETPDGLVKQPMLIPVAIGLLDASGQDLALDSAGHTTQVLRLQEAEQTFVFTGLKEKPLPSLLRGFSAPVKLRYDYSPEELAFLLAHDSDSFNRWDAGQRLAEQVILEAAKVLAAGQKPELPETLVEALEIVLQDQSTDAAVRARMLELPALGYLLEQAVPADAQAICRARRWVEDVLARRLADSLLGCYWAHVCDEPYAPVAAQVAQRSLKNRCLAYLACTDDGVQLAQQQYLDAENMTDQFAALALLVEYAPQALRAELLAGFYRTWQEDAQVVEMWLGVQAVRSTASIADIRSLMQHPAFSLTNPNRVRALLGGFAMRNPQAFHDAAGEGYRFLAEQVVQLDKLNPQIAARMVTPLTRWRQFAPAYAEPMRAALAQIDAAGGLSADLYEVVSKSLR